MTEFPKLERPPINEVVTGFFFKPVSEFTAVAHGLYWNGRRDLFTRHEIHPPITDDARVLWEGIAPARTWLITEDETRLVQLQFDRMFVNWRRRSEENEYPRFTTRGDREGLLAFALRELEMLSAFIDSSLGGPVQLVAVELAKIDLLKEGVDWHDSNDLRSLLPVIAPLIETATTDSPDFALRIAERIDAETSLVISVGNGVEKVSQRRVIRVETRSRREITPEEAVEAVFQKLNSVVNGAFLGRIVPATQLHRFGGTP